MAKARVRNKLPIRKIFTLMLIILVLFLLPLGIMSSALSSEGVNQNDFKTPKWVKDAVFYQIFTDRFRSGDLNNDPRAEDVLWKQDNIYAENRRWGDPNLWGDGKEWFGGDLQGVKEKISYLKELGINAIYFNPIFDSTDSHGYAVIDYKTINRYFGAHKRGPNGELILDPQSSLQVFEDLMASLDEENIKVILDGVFGHISTKHQWFDIDNDFPTLGAYESQQSPWYDWFEFYEWPRISEHEGIPHTVNPLEVDGFKDYIYRDPENSVIRFWNELGIDGWRLDFPRELSHQFWKEFRTYYKELNPDGYIVGEFFGDASPWLQGDEWDATMNYRFRAAVLAWANGGSISSFDNQLSAIREDYPEEAWYAMFNLLSSHDVERALSVLDGNKTRMKLAVIFQMTYPGAPVIYYGDEIGMTGVGVPFNRNPYLWPDTDKTTLTVSPGREIEFEPDLDMLEHHKKLIKIRKSYSVLRTGSLAIELVDDANNIYALFRWDNSENPFAVLVFNNGSAPREVTIEVGDYLADGEVLTDVLNEESYIIREGEVKLTVSGMWAGILIKGVEPEVSKPTQPVFYLVLGGAIVFFCVVIYIILRKRPT